MYLPERPCQSWHWWREAFDWSRREIARPSLFADHPCYLRQLKALWSSDAREFDTIMLWAVGCTALFSFCRMGELTSLTVDGRSPSHCGLVEDVAVDRWHNPAIVKNNVLRSSKTDQYGQGVYIYLGSMCLLSALLAYLVARVVILVRGLEGMASPFCGWNWGSKNPQFGDFPPRNRL